MYFSQDTFDIRCEWGPEGLSALAPVSDVLIIVDVFSFTTCVDVAVSRGAKVYPYHWQDARAREYAQSLGAILAVASRIRCFISLLHSVSGAEAPDARRRDESTWFIGEERQRSRRGLATTKPMGWRGLRFDL